MKNYFEGLLFKMMLCVENTEINTQSDYHNAYFLITTVLKTCSSVRAKLQRLYSFKNVFNGAIFLFLQALPINSHSDCFIMVVSFFSEGKKKF